MAQIWDIPGNPGRVATLCDTLISDYVFTLPVYSSDQVRRRFILAFHHMMDNLQKAHRRSSSSNNSDDRAIPLKPFDSSISVRVSSAAFFLSIIFMPLPTIGCQWHVFAQSIST